VHSANAGIVGLGEKNETMEFQSGDTVGPYTLETLIGAGGMGRVFRAVDTRLRRRIAIKFMLATDKADPDGQRNVSAKPGKWFPMNRN
jgi:serine/threonine protein kinase